MTDNDKDAASLRDAAEARLQAEPAPAGASDTSQPRLLHELQVQHVELEMQNDELHQSRAELEAALTRYTELYDFAPVGYLTLTCDGLIAEVNLTGAKLLGMERRNLLNRRFSAFVMAADQERWTRFFMNVKAHEAQDQEELSLQRGDGTSFHAQMDCVRHRVMDGTAPKVGADNAPAQQGGRAKDALMKPLRSEAVERSTLSSPLRILAAADGDTAIPAAGSLMEVSIAMTDISVRKGVESKLIEAVAAAEKANRAKTDFLSSMSHELRTPLNAILGFAQLMEAGTTPPTPSQQQSLDQILKAGWYLLELINEILDLAQIESGKVMLSREPVSLAEVMLECQCMIEPQAQKRGIGLTFPRFDAPLFVNADRTRVKQILINLLFNAIKYNSPHGTVSVDCSARPPDRVRVSIRDTGAGLDARRIEQLFKPFNRLGKEAGTEHGTGIGLVVTKGLVELMGGTVGVESTVGLGSVFWFELSGVAAPAHAVGRASPVAPRPMPAGGSLHTVLLVEDNPANVLLVEELIARRTDLRLICAVDGDLGIELARSHRPQVILMDINLPGINGIDAMKILRDDPATAAIPIIALSANAVPRDVEQALAVGFFNYLTKPIKVGEFMDALDVALTFSEEQLGRDAETQAGVLPDR